MASIAREKGLEIESERIGQEGLIWRKGAKYRVSHHVTEVLDYFNVMRDIS